MARSIGATIPANLAGWTDSLNKFDLKLQTINDNKKITLNSREFSQATGNSIGFQAKPDQIVTTTGEVTGGEISPRVQSGIGAGVLKGLHVDTDQKGTAGGDISAVRGVEIEHVDGGANTRNITGTVSFLRIRSNLSPTAISGDQTVLLVEPKEGSLDFTAFAVFGSSSAIATTTGTGALPANTGFIRVKIAGTYFKIPTYAD